MYSFPILEPVCCSKKQDQYRIDNLALNRKHLEKGLQNPLNVRRRKEIMKTRAEKRTVRNANTLRLNSMFLNNQQFTKEIKREIKKFLETNDNENTTTQNLRDAAKAVLRGDFVAIQSYHKK